MSNDILLTTESYKMMHPIIMEKIMSDVDKRVKKMKYSEVILVDEITGVEYTVKMSNGKMIYITKCNSIEVVKLPDKMLYGAGTVFDPTGMVVVAICVDGSIREVTGYAYTVEDMSTHGKKVVKVSYIENNVLYETQFEITVSALVDFEYIDNGDGTYTITGWKGTLNEQPSTEMVFPDDPSVIL